MGSADSGSEPPAEPDDEEPVVSDLGPAEARERASSARPALARRLSGGTRAWRLAGVLGWVLLAISLVLGLSGGFDGIARNGVQLLQCLASRGAVLPSPAASTNTNMSTGGASSRLLGPARLDTRRASALATPATPTPDEPILIRPRDAAMRYPMASAWSSDGRMLAILGRFTAPDGLYDTTSLLDIYSATNGQLIQALSPDAILLRAALSEPDTLRPVLLATTCASGATPGPSLLTLWFSQVLWSSTYGHLALPFYLTPADGDASKQSYAGLLVMYEDGSYPWAMVQPVRPPSPRPTGMRWDLASRTLTLIPTLAPAVGYHWSADGTLIPDTPLDTHVPPPMSAPGPVADPAGAQFTVWQTGSAQYQTHPINADSQDSQQVISPGAYLWNTGAFFLSAAWSPDERYIIGPVADFTARIQPLGLPTPSAQGLAALGVAQMPVLPMRDAALQAVLADLPSATYPAMHLAWRPDGRVLAAQSWHFYGDGTTPAQHVVTLYDSATGTPLAMLTPSAPAQTPQQEKDPSYLSWSPDGTRLLAFDGQFDLGTIWGPGELPQ